MGDYWFRLAIVLALGIIALSLYILAAVAVTGGPRLVRDRDRA